MEKHIQHNINILLSCNNNKIIARRFIKKLDENERDNVRKYINVYHSELTDSWCSNRIVSILKHSIEHICEILDVNKEKLQDIINSCLILEFNFNPFTVNTSELMDHKSSFTEIHIDGHLCDLKTNEDEKYNKYYKKDNPETHNLPKKIIINFLEQNKNLERVYLYSDYLDTYYLNNTNIVKLINRSSFKEFGCKEVMISINELDKLNKEKIVCVSKKTTVYNEIIKKSIYS